MALIDIKRIGIREYLGAMGIKPQQERGNRAMYLSPFRAETTASFSVNFDENVWYDHGIGEGGSIIDLVARMENCSVGEAIRRLENGVSGIGTPNMGSAAGAAMGGGVPRANTSTSSGVPSFPSHRNTHVPPQRPEPASSRISIVSVEELGHLTRVRTCGWRDSVRM